MRLKKCTAPRVRRARRKVTPASRKHDEIETVGCVQDTVLDSMEQGVIVWSTDATCRYFNSRIHSVLEYTGDELALGMTRKEFFARAISRGEFTVERGNSIEDLCNRAEVFTYDRILPSGRIIATTARPLADGGYIATFTDVTSARKLVAELNSAKKAAEKAEKAMKDALAFEKVRQKQMQMLSRLGEWLQSCKSLVELYEIVTAHMAKLLPATSGELYIYSNSRDVLDGACSWNEAAPLDSIQADDCWSLRRGRAYAYGEGEVEFVCGHVSGQKWDAARKRYFCIPIIAHGDTVGLLHVKVSHDHTIERNAEFSSLTAMRMFAIQCAEQISLAVANVKLRDQLRDQSIRDPMTGLYNRRYLLENMRREIGCALKQEQPISVVSIDADHFKQFNDNHGHDAGDTVLRSLGELMRKAFNGREINCRYGGEEFVIMLPDTDKVAACRRAEELRSAVEAMVIRYGDSNLPRVTISIGVATMPEDGTDPQALISASDAALYRAKADGRNRVCS